MSKSQIEKNQLKGAIVTRFGSLTEFSRQRGIPRPVISQFLLKRKSFAYRNSSTAKLIQALEDDCGISRDQLGITIVEADSGVAR